ncbi:DUF2934 domain-containing protein [Paeniroseomonas aquatica]|uniref:DUF2934 domain-containing protein n=1 Tax=Paeniroseomonas aquatica TaxID=373043 RepID=A0ABT8A840_9PROT|nr:DUF2934 domain-containing protein [Paeniroseomonas aquatica]MDN3565835.1 DUF2934 domain-containing protein [Paeniroseomonas aquatica]
MPDAARLARIRTRAYLLWLDDACPEGLADEYWQRARTAEALERMAGIGSKAPTSASQPAPHRAGTAVLHSA